ncbi:MAG: hypothetical protein ACI9KE_006653, partial [Polyangiales bacterium]
MAIVALTELAQRHDGLSLCASRTGLMPIIGHAAMRISWLERQHSTA